MPTRYNIDPPSRFHVPPLPSGYRSKSVPGDLTIPPVGIDDVDRALFTLFNEEIPFTVGGDGTELVKVPVIFAAGEKWALNKRMRALRDRNNALILPLITVVRTQVLQALDSDITGRGINQQTGELVVKRRLDTSDRNYQNLVNNLLLQNNQQQAMNLLPNLDNNIFETVIVPAPQFFTAQYDVTFWTQYTKHMNQLLEQLVASQLPQGNAWRLDTPKGYWFIATVDANTYTSDTNLDDYSQAERMVKYKFVIKVPGYILATNVPGAPVPLKRFVSAPSIDFSIGIGADNLSTGATDDTVPDPFLGSDDPTLPLDPNDDRVNTRADQRLTNRTRLHPLDDKITPEDPALTTYPRGVKPARYIKITGVDQTGQAVVRYIKVKNVNPSTGEMVLSPDFSLGGLTIEVVE
jgi:hypothetical protein